MSDETVWVTCRNCGEQQEDMGRGVACDHCGDPMPGAPKPAPVSATEPERRTYDPVGALISLPCYVCGKEERERPMTLSDKWRHEDPNDCITFLRARLAEAERVTVDDALKAITQRIKRLEGVQHCAQGLLATIFVAPNADEKVSALIPHTKALADALTAARGGDDGIR